MSNDEWKDYYDAANEFLASARYECKVPSHEVAENMIGMVQCHVVVRPHEAVDAQGVPEYAMLPGKNTAA